MMSLVAPASDTCRNEILLDCRLDLSFSDFNMHVNRLELFIKYRFLFRRSDVRAACWSSAESAGVTGVADSDPGWNSEGL